MSEHDPHNVDAPEQERERPLTAYERWELPLMGEDQPERQVALAISPHSAAEERKLAEAKKPAKPPTAAELEGIREAAYQEGLEEGRAEGHAEGRKNGQQQGHQEGWAKGYAEGLEKGRQEAYNENQQAIIQQLGHLQELVGQLMQPLAQEQSEIEQALLHLTRRVSEQVIARELREPSDSLIGIIQSAVAALPEAESRLKIYLHPNDFSFIQGHATDWPSHWQMLEDASLSAGGCRVENAQSLVDYSREQRFGEVLENLFAEPLPAEAMASPSSDSDAAEGPVPEAPLS